MKCGHSVWSVCRRPPRARSSLLSDARWRVPFTPEPVLSLSLRRCSKEAKCSFTHVFVTNRKVKYRVRRLSVSRKKKCGRVCFFVTLNRRKQLFAIKTPKTRLRQKNVVRKTMARELVSAFGTCLSCPGI